MNSSDRQAPQSLIYLQKVDALCDQFEAGWIKGQPQSIESLLPDWPVADRMNLLKELIAIEFYHRSKRGEQVEPAEYVKRFPEMDPAWLLEELHKSNQVETNDDRQLETRNWAINSSPPPGTHSKLPAVPGYEILGELGRGAMGIVYLARQTALTRRVALKMVLAGREANAEILARFESEAAALASVPHPNIVQIFECGEHDGCPYFSLELVEGGTLATKIAGVPQPPREAARLIETLARAIHHAHQAGIIHRDLKPANILVSPEGVCKLTDFGLAKLEQSHHAATATSMLLGTPRYMAPEQAAGNLPVGPAVDIYALGVILYELITGRAPFQTGSLKELLNAICHEEPLAPRLLKATTPRDLEIICLKCLEKKSHRRYESAEALADDLQRYLSDRPILARPVSSLEALTRWCSRNRTVAAVSAALVTVLLLVSTISIIFAGSYRSLSKTAEEAQRLAEKRALETRLELTHSLLNEVRMHRRSGRVGQFVEAQAKLMEARGNLEYLDHQGISSKTEEWKQLRKEAASSLLVPDITLRQSWESRDKTFPFIASCLQQELYARYQKDQSIITLCRFGSDVPICEIALDESNTIYWVQFSPSGSLLLATARNSTVVWKVQDGTPEHLHLFPPCQYACFSNDESVIALKGSSSLSEFHRLADGSLVSETSVGGLAFGKPIHPRHPWAVLVDGTRITVFNYLEGRIVWQKDSRAINATWAANGRWLATNSPDGEVRVHDSTDGELRIEPFVQSDQGGVYPIADSGLNSIYTLDWSSCLRRYDALSGRLLLKFPFSFTIYCDVAADGKLLGLEHDGQRYNVYAPHRGRLTEFARGSTERSVLSHHGHWWAANTDSGLSLFHVPSGEHLVTLPGQYASLPLAFEPDDSALLAYGQGLQRIPLSFESSSTPVLSIGVPETLLSINAQDRWGCNRDLTVISVPGYDRGTTILTRPDSKSKMWTAIETPSQNDVRFTRVSPDGRWVTSGSHVSGTVSVYSASTGLLHKVLWQGGGNSEFSADGRYLAVTTSSGTVDLYDTATWQLRGSVPGMRRTFSSNGEWMAVGSSMSTITLYATRDLHIVAELEIPELNRLIPCAFTPDDSGLVATTVEERRAVYFDLRGLRSDLKAINLDWEWPDLPPSKESQYSAIPAIEIEQP